MRYYRRRFDGDILFFTSSERATAAGRGREIINLDGVVVTRRDDLTGRIPYGVADAETALVRAHEEGLGGHVHGGDGSGGVVVDRGEVSQIPDLEGAVERGGAE